jgi:anaerobic ribonucleoside-triphosphate reductase
MSITHIKKRDGEIVEFDIEKIENAIEKAFISSQAIDSPELVEDLAEDVIALLEVESYADNIPTIENVQDMVETCLMANGHFEVAKAYILYRNRHQEKREEQYEKDIRTT